MNLEQRAARYFGVEDEPRTSVKTGRLSCFVVLRRQKDAITLAYYSEESSGRIASEYWWLTEAKRKALVEALDV
jgi:hypothetical protein